MSQADESRGENPSAIRASIIMLLLASVVLLVLWPVSRNGFVFDDNLYLLDNPAVRGGLSWSGLRWAFTTMHAANWHPLTWLAHQEDVSLFGLDPRGHHLVSLALHAVNTVLLFLLLQAMTGACWRSAVTALLFGIHPLHVESVAWVSERKDVLAGLFGLLTLMAWLRYLRRPATGSYLLLCGAFVLGLLSKPMLVTIPALLLVLDAWPLGRMLHGGRGIRRPGERPTGLLMEKAPLIALAAASAAVTFWAQYRGGAVHTLDYIPWSTRVGNALISLVAYLLKVGWPVGLAVYYPHPGTVRLLPALAAGLALGAVSWIVFRRRADQPWLAAGWVWYLVGLMPVIGLVQVGTQAMADRYTYLPLIGIFVAVVWLAADLAADRAVLRGLLPMLAAAILLVLGLVSRAQVGYWRDDSTLFSRALRVTRGNWLAHNNLGTVRTREGRIGEAMAHYEAALVIKPEYGVAHHNLANLLVRQGKVDEAIEHYDMAVRANRDDIEAFLSLGDLLAGQGDLNGAAGAWREVLRIDPGREDARARLRDIEAGIMPDGGQAGPGGAAGEAPPSAGRTVHR